MKKLFFLFSFLLLTIAVSCFATVKTSGPKKQVMPNSNTLYFNFNPGQEIPFTMLDKWIRNKFNAGEAFGLSLLNYNTDELGITTYRYQQTWNSLPVQGTMWLVHTKGDKIISCNGVIFPALTCPVNKSVAEPVALATAINYVHADTYQWQNAACEQMLKEQTNNPLATSYPMGILTFAPVKGNYTAGNFRLAYQFDIYATQPLSRQNVFVDALTGQVIYVLNEICTTNATGTAHTGYLGVKTITTDSYTGGYRLRETGRGNGIQTYNLKQATRLANTDFTDADNNWNNVDTSLDQYATDAHYGAEMTYDFYKNKLNRNSVDNAGLKLVSYVHYGVKYDNAFWDGREMNYGDGDGVYYKPFTAIDITGHEISHGVTQYTCALIYQNEQGALNEGYSDCIGTSVQFYGDAAHADWTIGEDIGVPFRNMAAPKQFGQPNTYLGQNWYTGTDDDGGVHTNSGVINYWYYLVSIGGSGTNDNGNSYNITGITIDKAAQILYRAWSVYMTSTSAYADARIATIQAAIDLYGACSGPEVTAVTNAWYAVGVGDLYTSSIKSDFTGSPVAFCSAPATVKFQNNSTNAATFHWDFGDGDTSTDYEPTHIYAALGNYDVKLVVTSGSCGADSVTKTSFITISPNIPCVIELPESGIGPTQTACAGQLFDDGGPNGNYTDQTDSRMTLSPDSANGIKLTFGTFALENKFDYLYIYDGPDINSPLINSFTGNVPPNGGVVYGTSNSVTIRLVSDQAANDSGFSLRWQCINAAPVVDFSSDETQTCTGAISFLDKSHNSPTAWSWDFGDGGTSTLKNPAHTYTFNGNYTVKLVVYNNLGADSLTRVSYINVDKLTKPKTEDTVLCTPAAVTLTAAGAEITNWYNALVGGTLLTTGATYTTPVVNTTTTYYAENTILAPVQSGGKPDNSGGGGNSSNARDSYLTFDVYQPVKLVSVTVYASGTAQRTIAWRNSSGITIKDTLISIANGTQVVTLNWKLVPGTNYRMGVNGVANLYRNNGSATLPYTTPGYVSVTGTNSGTPGYYYYFYNWQLQPISCVSERAAVTVYVGQNQHPAITPSGNVSICNGQAITLTSPAGGATYKWSNGESGKSINVNATGTYSVIINTTGGCIDTSAVVSVNSTTAPQPVFTYTSVGHSYTFTNSSANALSYTWNFGDNTPFSTVINPIHQYAIDNNYHVTLIACNGGCCDSASQNIMVATGVNLINSGSAINVYPNPTTGKFYLKLNDAAVNASSGFKLVNLLGQQMPTNISSIDKNLIQLDISAFPAGTYFLSLHNNTTDKTVKVIKLRN